MANGTYRSLSEKDEGEWALVILGAITAGLLILGTIVNSGVALSILWGWFIAPLGAPSIGVAHAIGISATMFFVRSTPKKSSEIESERLLPAIFRSFVAPWVAVLVGYGAKGFM